VLMSAKPFLLRPPMMSMGCATFHLSIYNTIEGRFFRRAAAPLPTG
jgi:hypothetical protein